MTDSTTSPSPQTASRASEKRYYIEPVTFKVENKIYRVPRHSFVEASELFETMFTLPQSDGSEGQTDDNPIELPSCTPFEFETLLDVLYPSRLRWEPPVLTKTGLPRDPLLKDKNIALLKLSTQWAMDEMRAYAIDCLSYEEFETIEKILLAKQFKISEWLMEGYTSLIQSWDSIPLEKMADSLGWEAVARLMDLVHKRKPTCLDAHPNNSYTTCSHKIARSSLSISPSTSDRSLSCSLCNATVVSFLPSGAQLDSGRLPDAIKAAFKAEFDSM